MKLSTSIFILLTLTFCPGVPAHAAEKSDNKVSITLVADEGVMISSGDTTIIIDSFGRSIRRDLLDGKPPFSSIQLVFVSHPHTDHFGPTIMGTFLQKHPETTLVSSPLIIGMIKEGFAGYPKIKNQLKELKTEKGRIVSGRFSGIKVDFIEFNHAVSSLFLESVVGFIVHIGGKKIFYLGESEMTPDNWRHHDLKSKGINTVILPNWTYKEETTRKILAEHIAPQKIVATVNVDHGINSQFAKLLRKYPKVTFLHSIMQSIEVE